LIVSRLELPDVLLIQPRVRADDRGYFMETWHTGKLAAAGLDVTFVQENQSGSVAGVLRGLHYQLRQPQGKLVRVVSGRIFDVAVDLRRRSATFGRWVAVVLSGEERNQIYIPPGFAHGFYVLSERAEVIYACTDHQYAPEDERTVRWDDPQIGIHWPISPAGAPILSARDRDAPLLRDAETYA
jgi:dTDP-4-dehydrorhamnose 3,5-epimerase